MMLEIRFIMLILFIKSLQNEGYEISKYADSAQVKK